MGSSKREINRAEMICSSHVCPHSVSACLFFVYMGLSLNSKRTQGSEDFQARGNERGLKNELLISVELTQMAKRKKKSDNFDLRKQQSSKKSQLELNSNFFFDG